MPVSIPTFVEVARTELSPADLDAELVRRDDVSAVIAVHMYGGPCDIEAIDAVVTPGVGQERTTNPAGLRRRAMHSAPNGTGCGSAASAMLKCSRSR